MICSANEKELIKRIEQGENSWQDFKFEIEDAKKIARSFSAFANAEGGSLLIGVKDNGVISGVKTDEEVFMAELAANKYCKPEVAFDVKEWHINAKVVIEVIIHKAEKRPVKAITPQGKWKAYFRVNDCNILANKMLIDIWKAQDEEYETTIKYDDTVKTILEIIKNEETASFSKIIRISKINRFQAQGIIKNLILLDLVSLNISDKGFSYSLK